MNLNYCPEQVTGRYWSVSAPCWSSDYSSQDVTMYLSRRNTRPIATVSVCKLTARCVRLLPSWPQCRLASSLMREGWRGHVCRCVRDRVCRRCASIVVVTRFLVWGGGGGKNRSTRRGKFMPGLCSVYVHSPPLDQSAHSASVLRSASECRD